MLRKNEGIDIVKVLGGTKTVEDALKLLKSRLDSEHFSRISKFTQTDVLLKIANAISMCNPQKVYINTGSVNDLKFIRQLALNKFEEINLPMEGHTIHYDLKEEQGRIVDRTFYIANEGEQISSLANKLIRSEAKDQIEDKMVDIMRGATMIIGFYMRGPIGAVVSNPAIEITSSAYVVHSAEILYRNAFYDFEKEIERLGHFYTNIHSEGLNRTKDLSDARVFMDRSHRTTYSFNCTYAGNTLLLKKGNHRFSVDKAIYEGKAKELAEHMFITGIDGPNGRVTWMAGAAPSGCGKTTTAMAGNYFIGDDLAQMWIADDGSVRSINPECGIFGIVEDVNKEGDPMLMDLLRNPGAEVIWSNVLISLDGIPHWVGNGEDHPYRGYNFQGSWRKGLKDSNGNKIPISHPNARCTIASSSFSNYSKYADDPSGVETRVITYSGRDSDTMPPVWAAKNSDHGVVIGACIVSAATATEVGATGIKRAPWANAPFIPGSLGDYMDVQFKFFGSKDLDDKKRPIMAGLNYFLTHEAREGDKASGKRLLGEKRDVKVWLSWLERYTHGDVKSIETPLGFIPKYEDLKLLFKTIIDKKYTKDLYDRQFSIYIDNVLNRINLQMEAYGKEKNIPKRLFEVLEEQKIGLVELKDKYASVVKPDQLI